MKKVIPGFICLLLLISSCDFQMPESVTVKGNPGLFVPLGSPFAGKKDEDRLENLISMDGMTKMMGDNADQTGEEKEKLKIYEVDKELVAALGLDPEVRTYLARYPLAEMPLELDQYTDGAMEGINKPGEEKFTIPSIPFLQANPTFLTDNGPETDENDDHPFIRIPLKNMAKLVEWVEADPDGKGCKFGLEIAYSPELAQNLQLKIPGFGFPWMKGIPTDDNGNEVNADVATKLRYYKNDAPLKTKFYPRDQKDGLTASDLTGGNLLVYAKITAPFSQQITLSPSLIFDWKNAMIDTTTADPSKGSFKRTDPINTNKLSETLGEGVSFKSVKGYIYMSAAGMHTDESSMFMGIYKENDEPLHGTVEQPHPLHDVALPVFPPDGEKFTRSYGDILLKHNGVYDKMSLDEPLEMGELLNNPESKKLEVAITIRNMDISRDAVESKDSAYIKFDLLLLIPMDLEASKEIPAEFNVDSDIRNNYVMLDLEALRKKVKEGDLFGRTEGEENALKDIKYVNISLKKIDINITDRSRLAVLVTTTNNSKLLEFKDTNPSLRLSGADLKEIPFSPTFSLLLKKDQGKNAGSFKGLRPDVEPKFDFKLYVEAKAKLEHTMDL